MRDPSGLSAIKRAVKANDVATIRRLLRRDPRLAVGRGQGWTPFQDAAFLAKAGIVKLMLAEGTGITPADIAHALHHAAQLPHIDPRVVEALVATGHVSALFAALYRGDLGAVEACLRSDGSLAHSNDEEGCPVLVRAAETAQEEIAAILLAHGADIEARGPNGKSALSSCACNQIDPKKRSKMLPFLLARGADVNGRTYRGRTPLFSAATAGWKPEESVTILLEHGADPEIRNDDGLTVLDEVLLYSTARARRVAKLLRHVQQERE